MSFVTRVFLVCCFVLVVGSGCGREGADEGFAWIRTLVGEPRDPEDVESVAATGLRDGEFTRAHFILETRSVGTLDLEVEIRHVPQPVFVSGRWTASGSAQPVANSKMSGSILSAEGLHFLGGQGGRPSLGGRFTLGSDGAEQYEVYLPSIVLDVLDRGPSGEARKGR